MKIAVLVSGGGTNLQAIIDKVNSGFLHDVEIALCISSSYDAYAIKRAEQNGIKTVVISKKDCADLNEYDEKMLCALNNENVELIVLAGFLSLVGAKVVSHYSGKIINIHPSLIPAFCGKGMYGIRPHIEAIRRGVKISGATVHFVTEDYDEGPIILQKAVEVFEDDTPEVLQKRIMSECEQEILPAAIRLIADKSRPIR